MKSRENFELVNVIQIWEIFRFWWCLTVRYPVGIFGDSEVFSGWHHVSVKTNKCVPEYQVSANKNVKMLDRASDIVIIMPWSYRVYIWMNISIQPVNDFDDVF